MSLEDALAKGLDDAINRVAIEAVPWVPVQEGDKIVLKVVGVGWFSIKHDPKCLFITGELVQGRGKPMSDGKELDGDLFRMGFVGTVMKAAGEQYLPVPGDFVVAQCLGTRPQKDDMDPYRLTQTVVLNANGTTKVPADMASRDMWVRGVDALTGEIRTAADIGLGVLEEPFPTGPLGPAEAAAEAAKSDKVK